MSTTKLELGPAKSTVQLRFQATLMKDDSDQKHEKATFAFIVELLTGKFVSWYYALFLTLECFNSVRLK